MSQKNCIKPLVLTSVNTAAIAINTWTAFSATGLEGPCFFLRITNDSNTDIYISFDSSTRHEFIAAGDRIDVNFQANSSPSNYVAKVKQGTIITVQGTAGVGLVYLAGYYTEEL